MGFQQQPVRSATSVRFGKSERKTGYFPEGEDLRALCDTLKHQTLESVQYLPSPAVENVFWQTLKLQMQHNTREHQSEEAVTELALMKARIYNLNALYVGKPIKPLDAFFPDTISSLLLFGGEGKKFLSTLERVLYPLPAAVEIFVCTYLCKTAPILFSLGFTDAFPHATQVARRAMVTAFQHKKKPWEILQAGLTGWMHDPKLAGGFSWENMAAHPLVSSALLKLTFDDAILMEKLTDALNALQPEDGEVIMPSEFVQGLIAAVSINNDSRYVLNNVILHAPGDLKAKGMAGLADCIAEAEPYIVQRFEAPSKGMSPELLPPQVLSKVQQHEFKTGIRNISPEQAERLYMRVCEQVGQETGLETRLPAFPYPNAREMMQAIYRGEQNLKPFLHTLSSLLELEEAAIPAELLLSHHDEVPATGQAAAWALSTSDPLLLSPHKILKEAQLPGYDCCERIKAFMDSFDDNIHWLPQEVSDNAHKWQKMVYESIYKSLCELTLRTDQFSAWKTLQEPALGLEAQIQFLKEQIADPQHWRNAEHSIDLLPVYIPMADQQMVRETLNETHVNEDIFSSDFFKLYFALERNYILALETSSEMLYLPGP